MSISSFSRPPGRRALFSWANLRMALLVVTVMALVVLMIKPLPELRPARYQVTQIQVTTHPV